MSFNVDFNKLKNQLLPLSLRTTIIKAYLQIGLSVLQDVHTWFTAFRNKNIYRLKHNSQTVYMEAVLNDYFDNDERRIRIVDVVLDSYPWLYLTTESRPLWLYTTAEDSPIYLSTTAEYTDETYDFIVEFPADSHTATTDETIMRIIRPFVLATKTNYRVVLI